ncbi:transposase, partial [Escherichia coli]
RQGGDPGGGEGGPPPADRQRLKELERENRNWRRSNDTLRQASVFLGRGECDRLWKK